jgi:hypothetical protein
MPIKFFSFTNDDHYAYPMIESISENINQVNVPDRDELLDGFISADCSVIDFDLDETDKPQEEDFDSEEEFDEAYEEWYSEMEKDAKSGYFSDFGYYDVYERIFFIEYSEDLGIDIEKWVQNWIDYAMGEGSSLVLDLMKDLDKEPGIKFIFSTTVGDRYEDESPNTIMYNNGKFISSEQPIELGFITHSGEGEGDFLINFIGDIIIKYVNDEKISSAGKFMASLLSIEGLEDYIKSQITPDEYYSLEKAYKSHSILNRFR